MASVRESYTPPTFCSSLRKGIENKRFINIRSLYRGGLNGILFMQFWLSHCRKAEKGAEKDRQHDQRPGITSQ